MLRRNATGWDRRRVEALKTLETQVKRIEKSLRTTANKELHARYSDKLKIALDTVARTRKNMGRGLTAMRTKLSAVLGAGVGTLDAFLERNPD